MFYNPEEELQETQYRELPEGNFKAVITESLWKESKKGTMMMELTLQVIEGAHNGVSQKHWLNLGSDNEMAAEIARKELHAICKSLKMEKPITTEDELVAFFNWAGGKPIGIGIKRKLDKEGNMRSRIAKFGVDLDAHRKPTPPQTQPVSIQIPAKAEGPVDDMPF